MNHVPDKSLTFKEKSLTMVEKVVSKVLPISKQNPGGEQIYDTSI